MTRTEIEALITKYNIGLNLDGKSFHADKSSAAIAPTLRAAKPEIMTVLWEQHRAASETRETILRRNVPGLAELRDAISAIEAHAVAFDRVMTTGSSVLPGAPEIDLDGLKAKFPRAAAYIKAEGYSKAAWDVKVAAGLDAMSRLIAGDDHEQVLADMDKALSVEHLD